MKGQLLGLKRLPQASGTWGFLLPRQSSKQKLHEPNARELVEEINPGYLRFDTRDIGDMNRGYGLVFGLFVAGFVLASSPALLFPALLQGSAEWWIELTIWGLFVGLSGAALTVAHRSARAPFVEPFLISRRMRRFYLWADKKQGWRSWDYDSLVPFIQVNKLVTTAGTSTIYALRLAVLDSETREIKETLTPAPVQRTPEQCGQIWEFIRRYMDGKPEELPAVRRQPSIYDKASDLVRFDRRFAGIITADHRFEPGIFPKLFYWFWAVFDYWQMRAMAWIQRTAPRPTPPQELAQVLDWEGLNPYRFIEPSPDENLALQGKLPRLQRRWLIAGFFATLLHGGLFVMMSYGILSTLWEK